MIRLMFTRYERWTRQKRSRSRFAWRSSIVRYVEYLQHPRDRGGQNLGHLGPIPEGFIAWAVGLLALVLVVRWIGTTR